MKSGLIIVCCFIGLIGACSSSEMDENDPVAKLSEEDQKKFNDYKAEVELGRNMAGRLLQYYGTHGDKELIGYVNQVGNYVASYGDYPDRRYMFAVIDNDSINAFACPGGYILVTLGTIKLAANEAELAMILGHEAAHVGKKHMFNTLRDMGEKELEESAKEMETKSNKEAVFAAKVRKRPSSDKSKTGAFIARYLSGSAGAGFSLLQAAKAGMSVMLEKGLDPKLEFEADQEGVKYAVRAGYEPRAMLRFLTRLNKRKKKVDMKVLGKTHPKVSDRKRRIAQLLREMKANEIVGALGKKRFKQHTKDLPKIKPPKKEKKNP